MDRKSKYNYNKFPYYIYIYSIPGKNKIKKEYVFSVRVYLEYTMGKSKTLTFFLTFSQQNFYTFLKLRL